MKPSRHSTAALMSILMGGSKRVTAIVTSKGMKKKKELLLFMGKCTQRTFKERKKSILTGFLLGRKKKAVLSRIICPVLFLKRCFAHFFWSISAELGVLSVYLQ